MLPRPYVGSYIGEKGHQILQEPQIIALSKSVEKLLWFQLVTRQHQNIGKIW